MADQFLSKLRVNRQDFVEAGGRPVLDRHGELQALLSERAGPEVAALFAEPLLSQGNDAAPPTVSWYAQGASDPQPLSAVPASERDRISVWLSEHLRPLRPLAEDPAHADLIWGAITTYGQDDIMVVDGRPVITNWGLMPDGRGASVANRPAHYEATLGPYMPLPGRPGAPAVTPASAPLPTATSVSPAGQTRRPGPVAWVPLVVLLVLAAGTLAWLLQPGTRLFPPATPLVGEAEFLQAQTAQNAALKDRIARLETALEGAVCRADGVLILPDGLTPEGLTPPAEGNGFASQAEAAPGAVLPTTAGRVLIPDPDTPDSRQTLLTHIQARTVLVLSEEPDGPVVGSGFLVGPDLVVTNQHVVAGAAPDAGRVTVAGGSLAEPATAQVISTEGPLSETGTDFALLRLPGADLPFFELHRSDTPLALTNVIAAGYPGDVPDLGAAGLGPPLTVTDGIVNTEQRVGGRTDLVMHSAPLSRGNSGGPLVDMCGRVVGVNTFVRKGPLQNRGFALSVPDLLAFLDGAGIDAAVVTEACAPVVTPYPAVAQPDRKE